MILVTTTMMTANLKLRSRKLKDAALLFFLTVSLLISNLANAQTKTIKFESGTWEEIKTKSAKENKLIFLDAYTTWCGPCKWMTKNVFTNDTVADYFNANFINVKIDMEAGEGIDIAKQYNVNVYPSLLFIDGQGNVIHRATGAHHPQPFIELAKDAHNPDKQYSGMIEKYEVGNRGAAPTIPNKFEIGLNISQYQKDFGIGLHMISPYFMKKTVAIKAGTNIQWLENFNGTETTLTAYQNIQLGMRGRSVMVTHNISIYGEGGVLIILPNSDFSSQSSVVGGYGLFGFEFKIVQRFAYFIELGGVGTSATADKIASKSIYSNGFLTNVGLKIGF